MAERVLVTGGTGFTGSHLCRSLVERGHLVRALVRPGSAYIKLEDWGVQVVQGDVRDRPSVDSALEGIDSVYHIAALFRQSAASRQELWETNVAGTRNMLEAALAAGVGRFVHCSTVGVHGHIDEPPATETTPFRPGDPYQESKAEAEKLVLRAMEAGLPAVVIRPSGIYGPGDLRFLKLFKGIQSGRFATLGSGQVLYQLVYIDDLIEGFLLCASRPEALGEVFILTGEPPVTLNDLVSLISQTLGVSPPRWRLPVLPVYLAGWACELVCRPLGIDPPLFRRRVDFFRKDRAFSIQKARDRLGFRPQVDLVEGLRRTAAWYRQQGLLQGAPPGS